MTHELKVSHEAKYKTEIIDVYPLIFMPRGRDRNADVYRAVLFNYPNVEIEMAVEPSGYYFQVLRDGTVIHVDVYRPTMYLPVKPADLFFVINRVLRKAIEIMEGGR